MTGERGTPTMDRADEIAGLLAGAEQAGRDWRSAVPADAQVVYDGHPEMADQVITDGGERIVRRTNDDAEVWWSTIGWSGASKAMLYRPVPHSPWREVEQMHTDDDGTLS